MGSMVEPKRWGVGHPRQPCACSEVGDPPPSGVYATKRVDEAESERRSLERARRAGQEVDAIYRDIGGEG